MPGPIEYDSTWFPSLTEYAKRDRHGRWRAGPKAPGYKTNQYIPTRTVKRDDGSVIEKPAGDIGRAYTMRQHANFVKSIMDRQDLSESQARRYIQETEAALVRAEREGAPASRIKELRRQLQGSP